jgi:hypothetical protein
MVGRRGTIREGEDEGGVEDETTEGKIFPAGTDTGCTEGLSSGAGSWFGRPSASASNLESETGREATE